MLATSPSTADVIREFWKDSAQWACLQKMFREAATNARQSDTTSLKHKLHYLLADPLQSLVPKITEGGSNKTQESETGPVPTAAATTALKALMKAKTVDGKKNAHTAGQYPSCFYSEGSYDPRDPSKGLFRSPFLIRVARHIWTTPTTAFDDSGKVPKNCKARAHAQLTWEGEMTGYICGQARTVISTSDWTSKDGAYNYERMFKSAIKLFEKKDDAWVTDTLAFYQRPGIWVPRRLRRR
ncbi:hypothetical protein C8F04DRAFT_668433 [Mycena alexandri]|uniref:Uncharacterized protein n=1 Tax=Mycena alexandri TaxID=1745969 RepID=A0AAD6X274_9AGAR|nr:hypothetical protein C8F04DRAFT_668433 [Mycena alexandri]